MAQVVFVHGVATRSSPAYIKESANRDLLLREVAFLGRTFAIYSPVWGDLVAPKGWQGQCFPKFGDASVGSFSLAAGLGVPAPATTAARPLAALAETNATAAVDTLFAQMVDQADRAQQLLSNAQLADFQAAARTMAAGGFTNGLAASANDSEFVDRVRAELGGAGSYGLGDWLKSAAGGLVDRTRNLAGDGLVALFRDQLNPKVAEFLGDIFAYLKAGAVRDGIRALVVQALRDAHAARQAGEALVIVGHSLGGVILYDLLSDPAAAGLPEDFHAELLLTVGSQPGLFEELKLFGVSDPAIKAPAQVQGPDCIADWLCVYDPIDLFGFRAQPIFAKARDFKFDSATGLLDAHTTYFKRPQFHARLRAHLDTLQLK